MKECDVDLMLARAQVGMSFLFAILIFALLFVLIFMHEAISGVALTIITSVIASLITVLTLQQNFFFARQRPHALPDPTNTTTTTTSTTTPPPVVVAEGSTLVSAGPPAAIIASPLVKPPENPA
jgi:hypothetical protein